MANENTTSTQINTTTSTVIVPVPEPGQTQTVTLEAGQIPQLNFDPGTESTQDFVGADLVFTFDNGAVLIFEDFAADVNDGEVSAIMLADGGIIPVDVLMTAWNLEVPETAAGAAATSGGGSRYVDDTGEALTGIDKLGVQDPDPFGEAVLQVQEDEQTPFVEDIVDDDVPVVDVAGIATADVVVNEGEDAVFNVSVTGAAAGSTITLALADGTAIDADYNEAYFEYSSDGGTTWTAVTGAIGVAAGDSSLLVRTDTFDDTLDEPDETFTLSATLTSQGTDYADSATATIVDDDVPVVDVAVSFAIASTPSISEEGAETATFTVSMNGTLPTGETASVVIDLDGASTATDNLDYAPAFEAAIVAAALTETGLSYDANTNTLTVDSTFDGSFSFNVAAIDDTLVEGTETIIANLSNATVSNGTATITTAATTTNITENDANITAYDSEITVNEAALDQNPLPDGNDLAVGTVTGSLPGSPDETASNTVPAADGGSAPLTYSLVGNPIGTYGTIQVNSDGSYLYTLTAPVDGPTANNGTNTVENADTFTYKVTDAYGNTTTATINVNIIDDVPTINSVDHAFIANEVNIAITGNINLTSGADGLETLRYDATIDGTEVTDVTSGNTSVYYYIDTNDSTHLIGSTAISSAAAFANSSTWVFEVNLNQSSETYHFEILKNFDAYTTSPVGSVVREATGPSDWVILQNTSGGDLAVLSGFKVNNATELNSWYNGNESILNADKVNNSGTGWGTSNNNHDQFEVLRIEFGDGVVGNDDSEAPNMPDWDGPKANGVSLDFNKNYDATDNIWVVVKYSDSSTDRVQFQIDTSFSDTVGPDSEGVISYDATTKLLSIDSPLGITLDYVDVAVAEGSGKLTMGSVTANDNDGLVEFGIPIVAVDGDGDTATGIILINAQGDNVGSSFTGTSGDDVFAGGLGNDILVGGDGEDAFFFSANAGEGQDTINDFNTTSDTLSFTDLLDVEPDGDFDAADVLAFTSSVTVTVVGNDLVLEIPDQTGGGADPTYVTLANVAGDYGDFTSGDSLTDLIDTVTSINVDTYAS